MEFGMFIKLAVDIERRIRAGGGEMHYYCEQDLLTDGSKQKDIWGAGFEPETQKVTYDSLINIRAPQNRSMEILDFSIRERVAEIVIELRLWNMTDLIQQEKLFVQDDVATRLSKIASNLGAIEQEVTSDPKTAASLIRESLYFIEWTVPALVEVNVEQASELVDVGRTLARWQYRP